MTNTCIIPVNIVEVEGFMRIHYFSFVLLFVMLFSPNTVLADDILPWEHHLSTNEILDYEIRDNTLWVGTTGGLFAYDTVTGTATQHRLAEWRTTYAVGNVEIAPDGTVWALTDSAVSRYDGSQWESFMVGDDLPTTQFSKIAWDSQSLPWAIDRKMLYHFDGTNWDTIVPPTTTEYGWKDLANIIIDSGDMIWINSNGWWYKTNIGDPLRIHQFDGENWVSYEFETRGSSLTDILRMPDGSVLAYVSYQQPDYPGYYEIQSGIQKIVYTITGSSYETLAATVCMDSYNYIALVMGDDGDIWKAENNLVAHFTGEGWEQAPHEYITSHVLGRIGISPDGTFWCISDRGIARYQNGVWTVDAAVGDEQAVVTEMIGFDDDSTLWCRTENGGIAKYNESGWQVSVTEDTIADPVVISEGLMYKNVASVGLFTGEETRYFTNNKSLDSNRINILAIGPDHQLWAATPNGISSCKDGAWTMRVADVNAWAFTFDASGRLWISSDQGLYRYDDPDGEGSFVCYWGFSDLVAAPNGIVWAVGMFEGVRISDDGLMTFLEDEHFTEVDCAPDGTIWIGTVENGIYRYANNEWLHDTVETGLLDNHIRAIESDPDLGVIVGTTKGMCRFHEGAWTNYIPGFHFFPDSSPLPYSVISEIHIDAAGELWVATKASDDNFYPTIQPTWLSVADGSSWQTVFNRDNGRPEHIMALIDTPNGTLWCGTLQHGLFSVPLDQVREIAAPETTITWPMRILYKYFFTNYHKIAADWEDRLMMDGKFRFENNQWEEVSLPNFPIMDIDRADNALWFSSDQGMFCQTETALERFTVSEGLAETPIRYCTVAGNGDLWVLHAHPEVGVSRYHDGEWLAYNESDVVLEGGVSGIYPQTGEEVIARSPSNEFSKFDGTVWSPYELPDDIPDSLVSDIEPDDADGLWITTNGTGLYHVVSSDEIYWYDTSIGFPGYRLYEIHRDIHGNLMTTTLNGLIRFTPESYTFYPTGHVYSYDTDTNGKLWIHAGDYFIHLDPSDGVIPPTSIQPLQTAVERQAENEELPRELTIIGNYPNPFNTATSISFSVDRPGMVTLNIYSLTGQKIRTLAAERFPAGTHTVRWGSEGDGGTPVSSGIYFVRLARENSVVWHRMLFLK